LHDVRSFSYDRSSALFSGSEEADALGVLTTASDVPAAAAIGWRFIP